MRRVARANFVQMIAAAAVLRMGTAASFATTPAPPSQLNIDWNGSPSGQSVNPNEERANDALREVGIAQSEISKTYWLLRHEFNNSGDWQEAVNAAQRAKANFELARYNALGLLQATPDYKSAEQGLWKAQQALADAKAKQPHSPQLAELASEVLRRKSILTTMEVDCVASDEKVRQARYAFIDADAKVTAMQRTFSLLLRTDPRWKDARSKLDKARQELASVGH